jgi:hypothetical protein
MKHLHLFVEPDAYTKKLQVMVEDFVSEYAKAWETAKSLKEETEEPIL